MKFGCCLNMVATRPDGIGWEWISALAQAGYDYAELPTAQMMALSEEEFAALLEHLHRVGIPCEASNNFFPPALRLTGPNIDLPRTLDYARRALDRAGRLGVSRMVFGSGPAKQVPPGFPLEEGYRQVVTLLQRVAPIARDQGVTIVIEPLRRAECNLINTFAQGVQLARDVNDPAVGVLADFYHYTEEREPIEDLLKNGREFLGHVHFANPAGRVYPAGAEEADYAPFLSALRAVGYNLRISCEAYAPEGFVQAAPRALSFLSTQFGN